MKPLAKKTIKSTIPTSEAFLQKYDPADVAECGNYRRCLQRRAILATGMPTSHFHFDCEFQRLISQDHYYVAFI